MVYCDVMECPPQVLLHAWGGGLVLADAAAHAQLQMLSFFRIRQVPFTLHYITLYYITLHYITLHCITGPLYITLYYSQGQLQMLSLLPDPPRPAHWMDSPRLSGWCWEGRESGTSANAAAGRCGMRSCARLRRGMRSRAPEPPS